MVDPVNKIQYPLAWKDDTATKQTFTDVLDRANTRLVTPTPKISNFALDQNFTSDTLPGTLALTILNQFGVKLGEKDFLAKGVIFQGRAIIGNDVTIDPHAQIGKEVTIGHGAKISSFALIGDNVQIGQGASIGYGAQIDSGVSLPAGVEIPADAHVTKDALFLNGKLVLPIFANPNTAKPSPAKPSPAKTSSTKSTAVKREDGQRTKSGDFASLPLASAPSFMAYQPIQDHSDALYDHLTKELNDFLESQDTYPMPSNDKPLH